MKLNAAVIVLALVSPSLAFAHEVEKGPNGGRVVEASGHHVELVPKGTLIEVFITDKNEKAVSANGYKGTAILLIEGKQQRITLESAGSSDRLTGQAAGKPPASPKGVVQLSSPAGNISAHFK